MLLSKLKKSDLIEVAEELELTLPPRPTIVSLKELIETSEIYSSNYGLVETVVESVTQKEKENEKKAERERLERESVLELEKIKLAQIEKQLELTNIQKETSNNFSDKLIKGDSEVSNYSLENLLKSVKTLTIPIPSRAESYNLFFQSLEKAFKTKNVPEEFRAEILLNILGEKATNLMVYLSEDDLNKYDKLKEIVLKEFQSTPQEVLSNFRKAQKFQNESYVQFASRLSATFDYYCQLRKVNDFKGLCELMISDKIFHSLDRELQVHIGVKQGEGWYTPQELSRYCDIYMSSKNKCKTENNAFSRPQFGNNSQKYRNAYSPQKNSKVFVSEVKTPKCVLCKSNGNHYLDMCPIFKKMLVNERIEVVRNNQLCFNCLNHHKVINCSAKFNCAICKKRHSTYLHIEKKVDEGRTQGGANNTNHESKSFVMSGSALDPRSNAFIPKRACGDNSSIENRESLSFTATNVNVNKSRMVLLSTAKVMIADNFGIFHEARALLDNGSQSCFISKQCADRFNLKREKINLVVSGLNKSSSVINSVVKAKIANRSRTFEKRVELLIVSNITDYTPAKQFNIDMLDLENLTLADENFNMPGVVDILLGAQLFYEILKSGQMRIPETDIVLQNSVFGFIATGSVGIENEVSVHCGLILENLDTTLRKFWEIENVEAERVQNDESLICEDHFMKTHFRNDDGRYVVRMPLREEPPCLGESKDIAEKRLNSLWRRLRREPEYLNLYKEFLTEYEELGHMQATNESPKYIMPHHGVYRPDNSTTKLRVVFNASQATSSGQSLNDKLYSGFVVQDDLFSILLRFRKHTVVFTADIKKMYRQIYISPDQCDLQCILWKGHENEMIRVFKLLTVTYGTKCAPYLATRVLQQLCHDEKEKYPLGAAAGKDFYVDDILSGTNDISTAIELQRQLISLLNAGGLKLHKWSSNNDLLLKNVPTTEKEYNFDHRDSETVKTLGLQFNPRKDTFCFKIQPFVNSVTKRTVLSDIARLFDPLGLLGPVIVTAKIYLQKLWVLKLDWDDEIPLQDRKTWNKFRKELTELKHLQISRHVLWPNSQHIDLIGFGDASKDAYGCVIYLRSISESGEAKVSLLCSKSRVAPLKEITIPKLELCAAELLSKLAVKVLSSLDVQIRGVYLYSDSTVVLAWIASPPQTLKVFVSNRVTKIQNSTKDFAWNYVKTSDNPADLISRGVSPAKIVDHKLWWCGPDFLYNQESYNMEKEHLTSTEIETFQQEIKQNCNLKNYELGFFNEISDTDYIFNITNSYVKLIRIMSFICRFISNLKSCTKEKGPLSLAELKKGKLVLIKYLQMQIFSREIKALREKRRIKEFNVSSLSPFIDNNGILRVGGRLVNANLQSDVKHPILLPKSHKFTEMIFRYFHLKNYHVGPQTLLYIVRQEYWPLGGRSIARKIVYSCVTCFKANPKEISQIMAPLPKERVSINPPFSNSGLDCCGPFLIRYKNQRKGVYQKIYVCVFVCFVTKAVHFELITELSADAMIACLKRFFARRGLAAHLFSDNGTNFRGAASEIRELFALFKNVNVIDYLCSEGVSWSFIPPQSPNFGGLWEAGVKSFKHHFKRVVGEHKLTFEEFLTVSNQIEAILNSRPLTPLSSDPNDYSVLTPGHFLIGRPLNCLPEIDISCVETNRLSKWQLLTKLVQTVWKKWTRDYLSNLQQRSKWHSINNDIKPNMVVLLKEEKLPVCTWVIGRIESVIHGNDGKIRVVYVRTPKGTYKRSISNVCILPISDNVM